MKQITYTIDELPTVVAELRPLLDRASVVTLTGQVGAGKTTLIKELLRDRGVTQAVQSPTFTYVHIYRPQGERTIHHFDLYRLNTLDEFYQQGFEEYLFAPNTLTFIEWPELIMPLMQGAVCHLDIEHTSETERTLTVRCTE